MGWVWAQFGHSRDQFPQPRVENLPGLEVVIRAAVVGVDRALDLEVTRPAVEGNEAEPEFLLRRVVEEGPPTVQVPFAETRMADREPGGGLGRAVVGTTAPYGGVALRGQAQDGEQHDQYEIHGLHRASSTTRTCVRRA